MHLELISFDEKVIPEFLEELELSCCEVETFILIPFEWLFAACCHRMDRYTMVWVATG
jgi:hypothetical protein